MDRAIRIKLGQIVREHRKQRGLTQAKLGRAASVTSAQISNIETGHTLPSLDTLIRIARTLRVPLKDIFSFEGMSDDTRRTRSRAHLLAVMSRMTPDQIEWAIKLIRVAGRRPSVRTARDHRAKVR